LPKAVPSKKPPSYKSKTFPEQIQISFVYHPMKLLILGLLVVALLAAGSRRREWRDGSGCYWQWRSEARARAFEAREEAREQERELRDQLRAQRDAARAERDRVRAEIRREMQDFRRDWRDSY
jgi:hypothetical protein